MPPKPIIAVIGTTGVGKSKVAVHLAAKLGAHIINGDSMQVYKGLDIITNKPDSTERNMCPHHLFDFIDTNHEYSVAEYTRDCIKTIELVHSQETVPVIVGGTNYYIQSILWNQSIIETAKAPGLHEKQSVENSCHESIDPEIGSRIATLLEKTDPRYYSPTEIFRFAENAPLHETLKHVDPRMANRWHPKDIRKIRRSLEVFYTTGMPHSSWYDKQKKETSQMNLRYPACVFWIYGKPKELFPRLDARVDKMIEKGMFDEMKELLSKIKDEKVIGIDSEYTRGILQAIGFKEFQSFFESSPEDPNYEKIKQKGIEDMKLATRQYAKRQVVWIKNKLAPECIKEHQTGAGAFYLIDATGNDCVYVDEHSVDDTLIEKVVDLAKRFLNGEENLSVGTLASPELEELLLESKPNDDLWTQFTCPVCVYKDNGQSKVLNGVKEWENHLNSGKHKKALSYQRKKTEIQETFVKKEASTST